MGCQVVIFLGSYHLIIQNGTHEVSLSGCSIIANVCLEGFVGKQEIDPGFPVIPSRVYSRAAPM